MPPRSLSILFRALLFALGAAHSAHATQYFLDSVNGNDALSGTAADTNGADGPWQSLARLKDVQLQPGDWVFLKCGSKWSETLKINGQGESGKAILVTSNPVFCSNKPTISGYEHVPDHAWQLDSGSVYKTRLPYNRVYNGALTTSIDGWKSYASDNTARLSYLSSCPSNIQGCLSLSNTQSSSKPRLIISPTFQIRAGEEYFVDLQLNLAKGVAYSVALRRNGPTYETLGLSKALSSAGGWQSLRIPVKATRNADNARLEIELRDGNNPFYMRSVSVANKNAAAPLLIADNVQPYSEAHHPNAGVDPASPQSIYLRTSRNSSTQTGPDGRKGSPNVVIGDPQLPANASIEAGQKLHVRSAGWRVDAHNITSVSGNDIRIDPLTYYPLTYPQWGYFLTGARWMLDSPGEWFYGPNDSTLHMWLPSGLASGNRIKLSTLDVGVDLNNAKHVLVSGLSISGVGEAVQMRDSENIKLDNLDVAETTENGVDAIGAKGGGIFRSQFYRVGADSIYALYSDGFIVEGNLIRQNGVVLDGGRRLQNLPKTSYAAIRTGTNSKVRKNQIEDTAYIGIWAGQSSVIRENSITNVCLVLNDCGGIYFDQFNADTQALYNLIDTGYGNRDGVYPTLPAHSAGLYFDEHAHDVFAYGNTITNHTYGAQIHNSWNITLQNNTLFGNRQLQLFMQEQRNTTRSEGDTHDNAVVGNNFMPLNENNAIYMLSTSTTTYDFGRFDDNLYSTLFTPIQIVENQPGNIRSAYTLLDWQRASVNNQPRGLDAGASVVAPVPGYAIGTVGNTIVYNGDLSQGTTSWYSGSTTSPATTIESSDCRQSGGPARCLAVTTGGGLSTAGTPRFSIEARWYRVSFDIRAEQDNTPLWAVVRRAGTESYDSLMPASFGVVANSKWKRYSFTFKSSADVIVGSSSNVRGARIDFEQMPAGGKKLWLANVEMVPIDLEMPLDIQLLSNPAPLHSTQVGCPVASTSPQSCTNYVTFPEGAPVSWPYDLPPNGSKVVYTQSTRLPDRDQDGITDSQDSCANTPRLETTNAKGCAFGE